MSLVNQLVEEVSKTLNEGYVVKINLIRELFYEDDNEWINYSQELLNIQHFYNKELAEEYKNIIESKLNEEGLSLDNPFSELDGIGRTIKRYIRIKIDKMISNELNDYENKSLEELIGLKKKIVHLSNHPYTKIEIKGKFSNIKLN